MATMTMEATFKSGAKIEFKVDSINIKDEVLTWESFTGVYPRLVTIEFGEIVALVRLK